MTIALPFVLAALVTQAPLPDQPQPRGVRVVASATVEILRGEVASERAGEGGLARQVDRREPGRVTINFE
ncbi:hypothetical protein [Novosphingobium sp.]|uniref:hypothetical protein n=1 Tax=Novosphingobium sp. TaxID=1874826 RepID=UPI0025CF46AB|nr:hypothetical protein [Novosphingobium sp.]MCC6924637.1 hypothetical protein [Novosphingobium sp.]